MSTDNVTYQDISTISGGTLGEIRPEQRDGALKGAQILAKSLHLEGVDVVFGYPGGANLEIFDVLRDYDIRCVRVEHEQGLHMLHRVTPGPAARSVSAWPPSGPGATMRNSMGHAQIHELAPK